MFAAPSVETEFAPEPIVAATPAEAIPREERIRALIEQSGIADWIREAPALAARHALSALGGHTGGGSRNFVETFAGHFVPEQILKRVTGALLEGYDAKAVNALDGWHRSRTGTEIATSVASAATPGGRAQLADYIERLRSDPPSKRRRMRGMRLAEAMGLPGRRVSISVAMSFTATRALDRLLRVPRAGDEDAQAALLASIRRRLSNSTRVQAYSYVLFVTRNLSMEALADYLGFLKSDASRWIWGISNEAYERSVRANLGIFERNFSRFLEVRDTPERRATQRREGGKFGAQHRDEKCVDQAFRRNSRCEDPVCEILSVDFLDACLEASRPSQGFCAESVSAGDPKARSLWRAQTCADRQREDRVCLALMAEVQKHCQGPIQPGPPAPGD